MPQPPNYRCAIPLEQQKSVQRARFGLEVGLMLSRAPGIEKLPAHNAAIYRHRNFLTAAECKRMVRLIDAGCGPTLQYHSDHYPDHRTSRTCLFKPHQAEPVEVQQKICTLMGLPRSHAESIQGQRYQPGQKFGVHGDFFFIDQPYWRDIVNRGGQRTWTAMIYLNEPGEGGATRFPYAEVDSAPERGTLLVWNNMNGDGCPNPWTMHEGSPVKAGTKYILTQWFRENVWG